jgi:hypothetical protein
MNIGFQISRVIREIRTIDNNDRLTRALYLANAVGYFVRISPDCSANECAEQNMAFFRKIVSDVNENISIDTKKAIELFKCVIHVRHQLMMGVMDPAMIQMAMRSLSAEDVFVASETAANEWLASRNDFAKAQLEMGELLNQAANGEVE